MDPTNKLRVTTPQALIDTDFEYGTQVSKWENLALTNNRPYAYAKNPAISITDILILGRNITIKLGSTTGLAIGNPIVINDSFLSIANGTFVIDFIVSNTSLSLTARASSIYTSQTASSSAGTVTAGSPVAITSLSGTIYPGQIVTASVGTVPTGTYVTKIVGSNIYLSQNVSGITASTLSFGAVSIYDANKTSVVQGGYYTASAIASGLTQAAFTSDGATGASKITVSFTNAHGLSLGNEIQVWSPTAGFSWGGNGAFYVAQVISPTSFAYYTRSTTVTTIPTASDYAIYARAQGSVLHRPFDGGVIFSSNGGSNYEQQIRQTRRYFRYQSGKGIQMSSGTILKPNFQVDSMTAVAATGVITVTLKDVHNLQTVPPDAQVTIYGANEAGFNGTFYITNVINYNSFTITAATNAFSADTTASGNYYVSTSGWYGAVNRLGIFDQQNGLFFEFDGQTLYAVRRNSTYQVSGRASVVNGSTAVTASTLFTSTAYTKQLTGGDFIVIKGQSYRVESVTDDSNFTISPAYRGASADNVTVSKTVDTKIPQSQWNLDKLNGVGPSGYTIDLTKMQMFYIDFSWYGAGFIRWGFRTTDGNVTYVHKMQNNNVNAEAYMRSGNLPGRYESGTIPPVTSVTSAIGSSDTTIYVADTSKFPSTGTLYVKNYNTVEHVYYTSKTATSFTVQRAKAGAQVTGFTPTAASNTLSLGSATFASGSVSTIQIGQRVVPSVTGVFSDACFVTGISGSTITLSNAAVLSSASVTINFVPMSATTGQAFAPATNPVTVELGYPTLAPTISHWGTSVIMDGRFDDDKSLLFTYGQTTATTLGPSAAFSTTTTTTGAITTTTDITLASVAGVAVGQSVSVTGTGVLPIGTTVTSVNTVTLKIRVSAASTTNFVSGDTLTFGATISANTKALMSIRIAPSVDNGKASFFGSRELINRMQLVLRTLDIALQGSTTGNLLVTAVLNGKPSSTVVWSPTSATFTSSLAQISDYSATANTTVTGGEVTGGFFVNSTGSVDLNLVRDLGNSILGGGATSASDNSDSNIYPDGPDILTIVVQNLSSTTSAQVVGRLSWTEAQA
jgi:hypothetical protein